MENPNIQITDKPLSIDAAYKLVLDEGSGGNCLFIGTIRNKNKGKAVTHIDFETYTPMAINEMRKIANDCLKKYGATKVVIHHRSGYVGIKDIAVIIAVSSGHREVCFKACRYAIDRLKETVPIWKKEHLEDGSYWVGTRP